MGGSLSVLSFCMTTFSFVWQPLSFCMTIFFANVSTEATLPKWIFNLITLYSCIYEENIWCANDGSPVNSWPPKALLLVLDGNYRSRKTYNLVSLCSKLNRGKTGENKVWKYTIYNSKHWNFNFDADFWNRYRLSS